MAIFSALLLAIDSARVEAVSSDVGAIADSDGVVALDAAVFDSDRMVVIKWLG